MTTLFVFSLTLLLAVFISELADRTVLSTAVLFLLAGFASGPGGFGVIATSANDPVVSQLARLALFSVLFTDGMRVGLKELKAAWSLPGRALLFGLPLTIVALAAIARWVVGLSWGESFLLGAVLSPTDPVFASAIVGRKEVPPRLRQLLNVESGLNDGLALPIVLALLSVVSPGEFHAGKVLGEVALGVAIGVGLPWGAIALIRTRFFSANAAYEPLNAFAIGLLVLSVSSMLHANEFLAAFAAGITVATVGPEVCQAFHRFGELVSELLKLAALLLFGSMISPRFLGEISASGYAFVALALLAARPAALFLSLLGSELNWRERGVAAWFGPKGFASVVYGIMILERAHGAAGAWARADRLFHLVALCIAGSILAHSSTDVLVVRWFDREGGRNERRDRSEVGPPEGDDG